MFKIVVLSIILTSVHLIAAGQSMIKYKDLVFPNTIIKKDIPYGTPGNASVKSSYYLLDLYEPEADHSAARPLIIWMHGGGFKYGSKKTGGIPLWSKTFAQRGYVCVSVNYRLSKKKPLRKFNDLVEGCKDAVHDLHTAIAFFKKNYKEYRIDTTKIIVAGNSAGAITGLHAVYSSPYEMMQLITKTGNDSLSKEHNPAKIAAIINFWGAIFDSSWLKNASVPIVSVCGTKDRIVSPDHKGPVNGSIAIHRHADSLGIVNALKLFQGYGHELQKHFNPFFVGKKTKKRWREAGGFAAEFLYGALFVR